MNPINRFLEQITNEIKTVMEQLYPDHDKRDEVVSNTNIIIIKLLLL